MRWERGSGKGKIMQLRAIFCNRKNEKRRVPRNTGREPVKRSDAV